MKNKKRLMYLAFGIILYMIGGTIITQQLGFKILIALLLILWGENISNSNTFKKQ
jgi:hypothetical protein